ncbi:II/X family phage/plasmid replication protein [Azomonas agilis]|uniref:II/X family phage/plasmid replication protein n=1 Tax=Azomonas agilis TaxID=116849 RepID=A0A562IYV4_9GAMM|nr:phage/plasmid replication protein, II/X family [Azomonas agilis]TWH76189.1 II/X family phage/plasmid replication protein [Azomonas agilis]
MLLDWITARIPLQHLTPEARECVRLLNDRVCCYCPKTGIVRYESSRWESVRSDSHQIVARAGSDLWVQGSPARVIGDGDTVFGAGASRSLEITAALQRMISFLATQLGVALPDASHWLVSRVDVTGNLLLGSLADVRIGLSILRGVEGGRYRVSATEGDTVYWSNASKLRKGKAYAKGPHLHHLLDKKTYTGRRYNEAELAFAQRLLRLELTLGREWFARNPWQTVTAEMLTNEWNEYFGRMIGGAEIVEDTDLRTRIVTAAETESRGKAAYGCWLMIQSEGWERAREAFSKTTWYRHLEIIRKAGLSDADISAGRVVQLRRRIIEAQLVNSWADVA